jgi:hypothetical protein
MTDYLNTKWWSDKTPLEKATGQYVLNVGGKGSKPKPPKNTAPITSEKSIAPSAKEKAASTRTNMRRGSPPGLQQDEWMLKDPLIGQPLDLVVGCPNCGQAPVFDRETLTSYRVRCRWSTANFTPNHCADQTTPWLKSLDLAVRHWTLSIKLSKP